MIVATPVINFLGEINSYMHLPGFLRSVEEWMRESEDKAAQLTEAFLKMNSTGDFILNLFMIGLLPALGEELVFRGVIQKIFYQWSRSAHVAVWTTAFIFSAMHMQFYGFLPRMVLGGMLGYMLVWSKSLWLPIIAHFVNNSGAVIFTYLFQQGATAIDPDKIGTESDWSGVGMSMVITLVLIFMLYKRRKRVDISENGSILT
jgi:membrane protease YdiL (CAAX protease family)